MSKTSYVAALVLAVWLAIAWRWTGALSANFGMLIAGGVSTIFGAWYIKGTQSFAERNPAQALLEGAELLEWQKTEIQAKGLPPIESLPALPGSEGSALLIEKNPGKPT